MIVAVVINTLIIVLLSILLCISDKLNNIIKVGCAVLSIIIASAGLLITINTEKQAEARRKALACSANQRVLMGAVEMYNMDNRILMTQLNIDKLVQGNYLGKKPVSPEKDCEYVSEGDLSTTGRITCKKHGNVQKIMSTFSQK